MAYILNITKIVLKKEIKLTIINFISILEFEHNRSGFQ